MEQNVGGQDKIIRGAIALVFVGLGMLYSRWFYIGTILLLITIFTGFCWPYTWFGINTNKTVAVKTVKAKKKR